MTTTCSPNAPASRTPGLLARLFPRLWTHFTDRCAGCGDRRVSWARHSSDRIAPCKLIPPLPCSKTCGNTMKQARSH